MPYYAKWPGTCKKCNGPIEKGMPITWNRTGEKGVRHMNCDNPRAETETETETKAVEKSIDKAIEPETVPTNHIEGITIDAKGGTMPEVTPAMALQILMDSMQPKAAPKVEIDEAKIQEIVQKYITDNGTLKVTIVQHEMPEVTIDNAHELVPVLLKYAAKGRHTYLYGAPGGGKSTAAKQVADGLQRGYAYISLTPQSSKTELFGYMDAHGKYVRTPFRDAYELGWVFNIEECDNGGDNLKTALNTAMENGHCAFPDGLVARHPNFVIIATGNTCGRGGSPQFPERRPFDQAFAKRFTYIEWNYDEKLEKKVALAINPNAGAWVTWIKQVRRWVEKSKAVLVAGPRETFRIVEDLRDGFDVNIALNGALWNGNEDLRDKVLANVPLPV